MLTRRTTAKVGTSDQYLYTVGKGLVEQKLGFGTTITVIAPVSKETLTESSLVSSLEKARRNNLISIDVLDW